MTKQHITIMMNQIKQEAIKNVLSSIHSYGMKNTHTLTMSSMHLSRNSRKNKLIIKISGEELVTSYYVAANSISNTNKPVKSSSALKEWQNYWFPHWQNQNFAFFQISVKILHKQMLKMIDKHAAVCTQL